MDTESILAFADPEAPKMAAARRKALAMLAENKTQPVLAEMAKEIQAGRLSISQAMRNSAYNEALSGPMESFLSWRRGLSAKQEDKLFEQTEQLLDDTQASQANTPKRKPAQVIHEADEEDLSLRSWLE